MAEFFKKIGHGVSVASKNIKESVDISKKRSELRRQISECNEKTQKIKLSIGDRVYTAYKNDVRAESNAELCRELDGIASELKSLEAQLLELDGIKLCEKCGTKIALDAVFCSACGERQIARFDTDANDFKTDNDEDNMISL